MEYKDILYTIAPCGLSCENCLSYKHGKAKHHSTVMDFCFQCDEFSCDKSNLDDYLKKVWI